LTEKSFSQFVSELSYNENSERQQATVRVLFALGFGAFFYAIYFTGWFGGLSVYVIHGVTAYSAISIAILGILLFFPASKVLARKLGMLLDLSFITVATALGDSIVALGYGGYLWVTIANGLRYGAFYLKVAHIASLLCFSAVLFVSDFWHHNIILGLGLWLWLLLLPIYVSKLLHILENAVIAANSANKAKSTFLANMSHEIRTPLTAIIGYAEVSLDSNQTLQERSTALKTIVRSGNHLLNVINDILDFSKVEADQLEVELASVELFQLILDVESLMRPLAERKALEFNVVYDFPLPTKFETDPVRIKQILLNLCSNAIKFTDEGSVSITISCNCGSQVLQFAVKDTGIGMTAEQLHKLFKPFQQADSSITRRFGGTGLGLSLSKCLAEKLDGTINVTSELGKGSRFTLKTRTGALQEAQFVHSIKQITYASETDTSVSEEKALSGQVLLAEDNPTNQQLLSLFLRKMGAKVDVAENGDLAVNMATQNHYDLIYMDMQMPVLSGVDAVKMLREQGYEHPIVALTANATNEDKMICIRAGCNDFLTKPIPRQKLYDMTSKYLKPSEKPAKNREPIISTLLSEEPTFRDLVERFVTELPAMLRKMYHAYEQEDWPTLKEELHSLKGMGGGFGYNVLTELAGKAEFQLFTEHYETTKNLLDEINQISELIYQGINLDGKNVIKLETRSTG
jgi:signal transduction histidine kinase/FixJ family two-component response regulator